MLSPEASPDREKLGFAPAVLDSFQFLSNFKFHVVDQKSTFVRFESPDLFINIYHGRISYQINVELGRKIDPKGRLTIDSIVDWAGAYQAEAFGQHVMFQVDSYDGVQQFVPKLANLVEKYAAPLLRNDTSAWESAFQLQSQRTQERILNYALSAMREKVDRAWRSHDYARVVELYSPFRANLSVVEQKRLTYAEAHPPTFWNTIAKFFSRKTS